MKIITDKAVYIQKKDIVRLSESYLDIPESVFLQIYATGVIIADDNDKYEFIKIEGDKEIEFFKNIDWMIDYNDVKDLSENDIIELSKKIDKEKNKMEKEFNSMPEEEKINHITMFEHQCDLMEYKIYSLRDILCFKQGHLDIKLPSEICLNSQRRK